MCVCVFCRFVEFALFGLVESIGSISRPQALNRHVQISHTMPVYLA